MFEKTCDYFRIRNIHVTASDREKIASVTKHRIIPRHRIIMHQGKTVQRLFFLNSGVVRLFRVHEDKDYTLGFVTVNDFISTPLYLLNGQPSSCALETLTDIDVLEWTKADILAIKEQVSNAYIMEMAIMDRLLNWIQDSQIDAVCLSAEQRYEKLLAEQPEVIRFAPLKHIASFLGIHQDSLSRIRKQVSQRPE